MTNVCTWEPEASGLQVQGQPRLCILSPKNKKRKKEEVKEGRVEQERGKKRGKRGGTKKGRGKREEERRSLPLQDGFARLVPSTSTISWD